MIRVGGKEAESCYLEIKESGFSDSAWLLNASSAYDQEPPLDSSVLRAGNMFH